MPLSEIQKDYKLAGGRNKYTVQRVEPIRFINQEQAIDSYLMGFYLGDGWCKGASPMFYVWPDMVEKIRALLPVTCEMQETTIPNNYRVRNKVRTKQRTRRQERVC